MTVYILLFIINLSGVFVAVVAWGGHREFRAWVGLFTYWVVTWAVVSGNQYDIAYYALMNMLCAILAYRYSPTKYGDGIALIFATMTIAAGLTLIGVIPKTRGLGAAAFTYYNIQAWSLHAVCLLIAGAAYARFHRNSAWR